MTNITGDVLRAVADWYDRQPGTEVLVSRLRDDATKADVEAQLLDNLAYVYCNAAHEYGYFNGLHEEDQTMVRAGIRAVLDALNDHVDVEIVDDEPRQWDRIEDVPVVAQVSDNRGHEWQHFSDGWKVWRGYGWTRPASDERNKFAPFTEIVDGAQ